MKVVVTGISSYLARAIFPLLEKDEIITEILGLDLIKPEFSSQKLIFKKRDVRNKNIDQDLKGYDALIHLAFIVGAKGSKKEIHSINIDGSKNVFNCAIKAGVKKIIHASSVAAYGSFADNPIPLTEEHPIRLMQKRFYYNETKYIVERYIVKLIQENPNVIFTWFRPHIFLGHDMSNDSGRLYGGERIITIFPDHLIQLAWFEDIGQAFYLALKKNAPGAFNIAGDNPLTSRELASRLNVKILKIPYKLSLFLIIFSYKLHLQRSLSPGWLRISKNPIIVDSTKAKRILGWKPKYDTFQTVKEYRKH